MSSNKLARGMVEIPKGVNTGHSENSTFMNILERTNALLVQFLSSTEDKRTMMRTELEESYFNLTLYNLKDSIKNKVEQDMWNNLFKKHVSELQGKMKSKDKVDITKAQAELSLFLDESMGFYSKFLDVLSLIHNIRLPGRRTNGFKSLPVKDAKCGEDVSEEDLCYIVQHCFVHLGDLSRYHNLHKLAHLNYQWAAQLNPTSGHAYNQLAILESSSVSQVLSSTNYTHLLRTLLYYDFANTCQTPFPATRINLDSLLRHIHQESVSELLTSNNSIDAHNCLSSLSVAWLHSYASMRLRNNVHRCRQLQQRILEWTHELIKHHEVSISNWRELVTIAALQCALLSVHEPTPDLTETNSWSLNVQQFTEDFINAICSGLVSISYDVTVFETLFTETSCASILVIFMAWCNQYLTTVSNNKSNKSKLNLSLPFGEQFVKILNILHTSLTDSFDTMINLPTDLPELQYLSGYEPLKIPSKKFDIFANGESIETLPSVDNVANIRKSFIVSTAIHFANQYCTLLKYDPESRMFSAAPPIVIEIAPIKKVMKTEPMIVSRKPVNVALASIKNNTLETNNGMDHRKNVPYKVSTPTNVPYRGEPAREIVTDVKIAKCIQDHIALETKATSCAYTNEPSLIPIASHAIDDVHGMAPAPGLILSSNLPPEYKSMSIPATNTSEIQESQSIGSTASHSHINEPLDAAKSAVFMNASKIHSYNPNREQFEKDLPPRFANKRCSSQKENKTGFKSLNYWDSTNSYQTSGNGNCDTNLTKKESELLPMPPSVPSSWLTDEQHDRANRSNMSTMSSLHFQMPDTLNQQRSTFNNSMQQNSINMFQPAFNQFQNNQPIAEQDSKMNHFLQTTSSNPNNFSYQTPSEVMDQNRIKFDQMFLSQNPVHGIQHNFPPIPPPPPHHQQQQQQLQSTIGLHNNSFDHFPITRSNNYDKPIFSTSNQSGFVSANPAGYNTSPIMAQQMAQHQKHNQQIRSNNPLFNLLPGFINEMQR